VANSLLRAAVGAAAARASRSKLSASSKTAFLAPGSFNCPATSRACSARSSHSKASFKIDGIWSSLNSFLSLLLSLSKLRLRYQGHNEPNAETTSHQRVFGFDDLDRVVREIDGGLGLKTYRVVDRTLKG
jgi:hypothetical protein